MERFTIRVANSAKKNLKKIPLPWQGRIINALEILEANPFIGVPMKGAYKGKCKIRIWPYRIIYRIFKNTRHVEVYEIDHRGGISYK